MAGSDVWDVIVVGAGIIGCGAAYHLSKAGARTLLLEQFFLPHDRGSSASQTRIIRNAYDAACYAAMMPDAFDQWRHLETESGQTLLKKTTLVVIEGGDLSTVRRRQDVMTSQGLTNELLPNKTLRQRFPALSYPADHQALFDPEGGVLVANKCLRVLQDMVVRYGGRIQDGTQVLEIRPSASIVTLDTNRGRFTTRKLVLCAGPWANDMFHKLGLNLPLTTMPGRHVYWRVRTRGQHVAGKDPVVVHKETTADGYRLIYLLPSYEYPGLVKVSMRKEPSHRYCHPDGRDADADTAMLGEVARYIERHFPHVDTTPALVEPCVYTMTPDHHVILDHHPRHNNILFAAGFSGHGFKLAPVIGEILKDLVLEKTPAYDLTLFRISRFEEPPLSKI